MSIGNTNTPNVITFLTNISQYLPQYALITLLVFVISHGLIVTKEYILTHYYKTANLTKQMFMPYSRIIIQQLVVILGGYFLLFDKTGKLFMLIFVLIKIFVECFIDFRNVINDASSKNK